MAMKTNLERSTCRSNGKNDFIEKEEKMENSPPDGGWGWMIVFAVFVGNCLFDGIIGSYGILYPAVQKTFGSNSAVTSMAGSLVAGVYQISSPLVGILIHKYGCRKVCFAGGCIGAAGFILASMAQNIAMFMISFGAIVGLGIGLNFLPGHVLTNAYFDKKRGLANGIVSSGAGFGVFILAPILQILLHNYGIRGTLLIAAGIFMQLIVCSTLMRPLNRRGNSKPQTPNSSESVIEEDEEQELLQSKDYDLNNVCEKIDYSVEVDTNGYAFTKDFREKMRFVNRECIKDPIARLKTLNRSSSDETLSKAQRNTHYRHIDKHLLSSLQAIPKPANSLNDFHKDREITKSQFLEPVVVIAHSQVIDPSLDDDVSLKPNTSCCNAARNWRILSCDWSIFRNKNYVPLLLGGVLIQMGQFIPNTFLPDYCYDVGLTPGQVSLIIALYGASNIVGRFSAGCLANFRCVDALWLCNFGMFMCGVGCAFFPLCKTFSSLILYALGVGYFIGYFPPLQVLIMVEHLGADNLTAALGFLQMAKGPAALLGPPLAGVVYQHTKTYTMSIMCAAILFLLSAGIQSLVPLVNCISRRWRGDKRDPRYDISVEVNTDK